MRSCSQIVGATKEEWGADSLQLGAQREGSVPRSPK